MSYPLPSRVVALCAALALAVIGLIATTSSRASADTLLIESFQNGTVSDAAAWSAGGSGDLRADWPGGTCLTAGTDTTQTPVPGCATSALDPAGTGALRLTPNDVARAGFALYNRALPTTGGLDITFDQAQYGAGGYAADGISLFLVDGSTNLTQPGASGGGLGYSAGFDGVDQYGQGVTNGLLGIGIDKWGNFSATGSTGSGCTSDGGPGSMGPGQTPNVVAIRGPGNGSVGYCWLGASANLGTMLYGDNTRTGATVHVHVVVDPSTVADRHVTVYLNGIQEIQIPVPEALLDATTFKFGFGGSTGAVTDIHEVWNLNIESVIPVPSTTSEPTSTDAPSTEAPTTEAPTSEVPATETPASTGSPTSVAPTTTARRHDPAPRPWAHRAVAVTAVPRYTG